MPKSVGKPVCWLHGSSGGPNGERIIAYRTGSLSDPDMFAMVFTKEPRLAPASRCVLQEPQTTVN